MERRDEQEVAIYETFGDESLSEDEIAQPEPINEEIETEASSHQTALDKFLEPPTRCNEPIINKVSRVRREIEDIRKAGAILESKQLLDELYDSLKPKTLKTSLTSTPTTPTTPTNNNENDDNREIVQSDTTNNNIEEARAPFNDNPESQREFVQLESRLAALEQNIGSSVRSPRQTHITSTLESMKQILDLLASDPEQIKQKMSSLPELPKKAKDNESQQITWLYNRLSRLDNELRLVPQVASRLRTLQVVHSEAASTEASIKELREFMLLMETEVKAWRTTLSNLEVKVDEYVQTSNANIDKLIESR